MKQTTLLLLIFFSNIVLNAQIKVIESQNSIKVYDSNFENSFDNRISYIIGVDQFDESRLNVRIFESKCSSFKTETVYSNKATYIFEPIGIKRGLKLASINFNLNRIDPLTNQSYKIDSIEFEYKFAKELSLNKETDFISFPNVVNSKQIGSLIIQKDYKLANQTQSTDDWFDSNLDYYKFYSQKDGIARINHSELLKFNSSLNGKDIKNIQIFNRGQKIKFYSTNNTNGSDNFIYLVASHAYGDTSYYDFYNGKEPYFITYNPNDISTTYELIDNNLKGQSISEVEIDNHYEKDRVYGNGVNVVDTETSLCENWYFEELRVQNDYNHAWEFFTDFSLFPTSDLKMQYEYASNIYYLPPTIHNKTLMNINSQVFDTVTNTGSGIINREINISKINLLQGGNTLNLNSYRVVDDQAVNDYNGIIGFDYYKIKGMVRPISENGYFSFLSDNNVNSNVTVSGFPDNLIVAIDTTNNTIQFPSPSPESVLSIESKEKFASIFFNSQMLTSHIYGYHIVTDLNGNKTSKDFKNENDFIVYLEATDLTKDNAVIINLENNISSKLKSKLQERFKTNLVKDASNKFLFASINNNVYESNGNPIFENLNGGDYYKANISLLKGEKSRKILNSKTTLQEIKLIPSKIKKIEEGSYDAFYVYHPEFEASIDKYISYMSQKTNKKLLKLDVEQLYDTYGYGIESPHSIKNFFQISYDSWKKYPEFLTIVGDATWDPKMQRAGSFVTQLVPAYGIPYTDNFYGTLDGDDIVPELVIGRIPVNTNQELENYLDKVKTFYEVPLNPWMKNVLQIAGGDDGQKDSFKEIMEGLNGLFARSELAFDTTIISRASDDVINETQADEIKKEINEGKMWVNFLGHGSPSVIDMSGWEAPNLNNQGKYGVLNTLSCNTSAFAEPSLVNSIGEEFVNIKEKGFIACIGGTSTTDVARALTVSSSMFLTMFRKERPERNIGRIFDSFKARNYTIANVVNQVVLLGDPLIDLRIPIQPDLILNNKDISIKNEYFSTILTENNKTANIEIKFYNLGTRTTDSVNFRLIHTFNNTNDTIIKRIAEVLFDKIVSFDINIENAVGEHRLSLFADNDSLINDIDYSNNLTNLVFNVFSEGIIPLEPLDNWDVSATKPVFRFVNPTNTQKSYYFEILDDNKKVVFNTTSPSIFENYIEVTTSVLKPNQKYTIEYSTQEILSGVQSATNKIVFHTLSKVDSIVHYKVDAVSNKLQTNNLKIVDDILKFDDKDFGVKLSSARGSENAERHSIINTYDLSNDSALFSYVIRLRRGFNIVVIPDELDDSTFTNIQFDTWATRFNDPDDLKDARLLDEFLSDSLKKGDYLLLATADVPMRAPDKINDKFGPDSIGSSTRLKKILNDLGAKFANNLEFNSSYVLFTRIGYPESTIDKHTLGDTIQLTSELTRYQTEANIKILNIGNAKRLIQSNIELNSENTTINSKLINKNFDTVFTFEGINSDLSEFDTQQNPSFDLLTNIKRDSIGAPFEFSKFTLDFIPEPELAVVKSKTNTDKSEYERGFNALYNYQIENISTRSDAENLEILLTLENNFRPDSVLKVIEFLPKNNSFSDTKVYETQNGASQNSIIASVDPYSKVNELFLFNNESKNEFRVKEDTTKPWLIAYADSIEIIENNFVSQKPVFIVELYDKSPQLILKDNVILARVNRKIMLNNTTDTFDFEIINKGELKARMTFSPNFLLDIGENTLFVIGEDATGNHADTLDLSIFVSKDFKANNLMNYPNPFEESTAFRFNYIGKDSDGEVQISIFNAIGSKVRKLNRQVNFGVNEMLWDGKDDFGNSISSGVYFYRLDIVNKPSEPVFGKMIKVN